MIIYYTDKYTGSREASRKLLTEALAEYTGDDERAAELICAIRKGEHGKPYIDGFDCFSISHTGRIWAVLIADCECGFDIQLARSCNAAAIATRWFATEDACVISEMHSKNAEDADDEFFRLWTKREALVKALGGSVYESGIPAVSADIAVSGGRSFTVKNIDLPESIQQGSAAIHAAVCMEEPFDKAGIRFFELQGVSG